VQLNQAVEAVFSAACKRAIDYPAIGGVRCHRLQPETEGEGKTEMDIRRIK
jgi:hypothetical protein